MDGKLCIWDLHTLRVRHILQHEVGAERRLRRLRAPPANAWRDWCGRRPLQDGITRVQWHASEPFIYSCSTDKVRLGHRPAPTCRSLTLTDAGTAHAACFGCMHQTIRLWDARSGECVRTWRGHRAAILDMSVSKYVARSARPGSAANAPPYTPCPDRVGVWRWPCRDGRTVLTCGDDGTARVFRY